MKTHQQLKAVVKQFNELCQKDKYKEAGELARSNKPKFIAFIKSGGSQSLEYAYSICHVFNMPQIDCENLIF